MGTSSNKINKETFKIIICQKNWYFITRSYYKNIILISVGITKQNKKGRKKLEKKKAIGTVLVNIYIFLSLYKNKVLILVGIKKKNAIWKRYDSKNSNQLEIIKNYKFYK